MAQSLLSGQNIGILLGNFAQQHPQAATLHALASKLAVLSGGKFGFLGEAANSLGAYVAKAIPEMGALSAKAMLDKPRRAYVLLGVEPELDCADGAAALRALNQASSVIMLSPFKSAAAMDYADCLLPVSPFTETSGTFVNCEGRVQSFYAAVKPLAETRPAWKVLRVLANLLDLPGFDYASSEDVKAEALGLAAGAASFAVADTVVGLDNGITVKPDMLPVLEQQRGVERVADVPVYFADQLVRYAPGLQKTRDAAHPTARMNAVTMARFGLQQDDWVKVGSGDTAANPSAEQKSTGNQATNATLRAELDVGLPDNVVRIAAGHAVTVAVGGMFATVHLEKANKA
jgi:NADH-quinone oxidoreductase subunit G